MFLRAQCRPRTSVFQSASSALIIARHPVLSCAIWHTSSLSTPILSKSLSMFFIHVNLRAPLAILSGLSYSFIDILIGVSSGPHKVSIKTKASFGDYGTPGLLLGLFIEVFATDFVWPSDIYCVPEHPTVKAVD